MWVVKFNVLKKAESNTYNLEKILLFVASYVEEEEKELTKCFGKDLNTTIVYDSNIYLKNYCEKTITVIDVIENNYEPCKNSSAKHKSYVISMLKKMAKKEVCKARYLLKEILNTSFQDFNEDRDTSLIIGNNTNIESEASQSEIESNTDTINSESGFSDVNNESASQNDNDIITK